MRTLIRSSVFAIIFALVLAWGTAAHAAEFRTGDSIVIPAYVTIADDLYAAGSTVRVDGSVTGNVFAAGQNVTIEGTVGGSLFAAAQNVQIRGTVHGTAIGVAQSVAVDAAIGRDLGAAAAAVAVGPMAAIAGDAGLAAGNISLSGPVGRRLGASGAQVTIDSTVGGPAYVEAERLRLGERARLAKDLIYTSAREFERAPGATIGGRVVRREPGPEDRERAEPSLAAKLAARTVAWVRSFVGWAIFGLIVVTLFPIFGAKSSDMLVSRLAPSIGWGFAILVFTPVAALALFVVGVLIGGAWIAVFAGTLYAIAVAVGYVVGALTIGRLLFSQMGKPTIRLQWAALLGVFLVQLVGVIPFLGGLARLLVMLFGLGAVAMTLRGMPVGMEETPSGAGPVTPEGDVATPTAPPHAGPPEPPSDAPPETPEAGAPPETPA